MFMNRNLSVIAYANGFTLWHYTCKDTMEDVCVPGYFDKVKTLCNSGDIVIINAVDKTEIKVIEVDNDIWLTNLGHRYGK